MSHLVVLDFEWTADDTRAMLPVSEITQFPSVLVKLEGAESAAVSEFNKYVRPTLNPKLTPFSVQLTGITQDCVDASGTLHTVLVQYLRWLRLHGLIDEKNEVVGHWSLCTWSDADIGSQLVNEFHHKGIPIPPCFSRWVNLKLFYKQHYRQEAKGGLQACVERLGIAFEGRAHDGLIDSRNTAAIVLHMARGSMMHGAFVFRRTTRGLGRDGVPYGQRKRAPKHSSGALAGAGVGAKSNHSRASRPAADLEG